LRHSTVSHKSVVATGHHIAVVGSITPDEMRTLIDGISIANGFANRFLFVWSRMTTWLPEGGAIDPVAVAEVADQVEAALEKLASRIPVNGTVHLPLNPVARERWAEFYLERRTGIGDGITKVLTARQVVPLCSSTPVIPSW
jgi:hypothetical protein